MARARDLAQTLDPAGIGLFVVSPTTRRRYAHTEEASFEGIHFLTDRASRSIRPPARMARDYPRGDPVVTTTIPRAPAQKTELRAEENGEGSGRRRETARRGPPLRRAQQGRRSPRSRAVAWKDARSTPPRGRAFRPVSSAECGAGAAWPTAAHGEHRASSGAKPSSQKVDIARQFSERYVRNFGVTPH